MDDSLRKLSDQYLRRERFLVMTYILCVMVPLAREIYRRWSQIEFNSGHAYTFNMSGSLYAPEAYRPGMSILLDFVTRVVHLRSFPIAVGISDLLFGIVTIYVLYAVSVDGVSTIGTGRLQRIAVALSALAFIHFPLLWTLDWMRYYTLPCACYLAASLWLLIRYRQRPAWIYLLYALTVLQGFIRAEIPFFLGLTIVLLAVTGRLTEFGNRRQLATAGLVVFGIAGAIQVFLQFILHPHTMYPPGVKQWMLPTNLGKTFVIAFTVAMLPVMAVYIGAWCQRHRLRSIDWLCLGTPFLYLPLWLAVGSAMEVRVFVPLFLMLTPAAAHIVGLLLTGDECLA